jgi:hypothetical protein
VDDWGREFAGTDAIRCWSDREFIGQHVNLKTIGGGSTSPKTPEPRAPASTP